MMIGDDLEMESLLERISSVIIFIHGAADCLRIISLVQHIYPDSSHLFCLPAGVFTKSGDRARASICAPGSFLAQAAFGCLVTDGSCHG